MTPRQRAGKVVCGEFPYPRSWGRLTDAIERAITEAVEAEREKESSDMRLLLQRMATALWHLGPEVQPSTYEQRKALLHEAWNAGFITFPPDLRTTQTEGK